MRRRTPAQKRISESKARFNVACFGRQSGKTTYGIDKMTYKPLQGRAGGIYWFIEPTSDVAEVAFNRHWKQTPAELLACKPNETERKITFINGATVFYKSGEVFENLRAETLDGCIIDEVRQQDKNLWPRIVRPMLAARKGWCDFLSTANGFEHFYDLFERARMDQTGEWAAFHAPSWEAWWWTPDEIESAKRDMSDAEFAQEIGAEFRDLHTGKAYTSNGEHNHAYKSPFTFDMNLVAPHLPVVLGCDFNVGHMRWVLMQFRNRESYAFDEIAVDNTNTEECAGVLVDKLEVLRDQGLLEGRPQVRICGDATGESRSSKATQSDYDIITAALTRAKLSWTNDTPKANPPVKHRVNTVNKRLRAADGSTTAYYHPINCAKLRRDLERTSWKDGADGMLDQKTDSSLTHASDALGYPLCVYAPIEASGGVGKLVVVRR